jgi:uncharacterized protein
MEKTTMLKAMVLSGEYTSRAIRIATVSIWCFLAAVPCYADYNSAAKAYEHGDYEEAYDQFRALAELGHGESQHALAVMYLKGHGVAANTLLAYAWTRLSADNGSTKGIELERKIRAILDEETAERSRNILGRLDPSQISGRLLPKIIANCDYQDATPPQPLRRPLANYPGEMVDRSIEGSVLLDYLVAVDGSVREVRVIDSLPPKAFDDAARRSVLSWKFKPAMRRGEPFAAWGTVQVIFKFSSRSDVTSIYDREAARYMDEIRRKAEAGDPVMQYVHGLFMVGHPVYKKPWSEALPWMLKSAQVVWRPPNIG